MSRRTLYFLSLFLSLLFATASCAQSAAAPKLTVTPMRVLHHGHVVMQGSGFTPKANVYSHLKRPDGTEFPVLPMMTNERGEITHDIDTLLLLPGVFQVWVEDPDSKTKSNVVRFEVTDTQQP